jgi:uncharacterized membrane protein
MRNQLRVLIAGESWVTHSIHQKGFDSFTTTAYEEGVGPLRGALESQSIRVDYMPNHMAATDFPGTPEALEAWDVVILSDIGANTLLLHPDTFERSEVKPNRLVSIRDYVEQGGGLVMIGGYLTFQGIDGKARYAGTPVEDVLPVSLQLGDDRVEAPSGVLPSTRLAGHPIVDGLPSDWPALLGYNQVSARPEADLVVSVDDDPLVVAAEVGRGRSAVFTSDCGPHWCPPPFVAWAGYAIMWNNIVRWVARR